MMFFLFRNKENEKLFGPPINAQGTNGRDLATRTCVCLYQQPVTWIFTRSILSDSVIRSKTSYPFIENYYLIIIVFSHPHFNIDDIFIQKKTHEVSTQMPLTSTISKLRFKQ